MVENCFHRLDFGGMPRSDGATAGGGGCAGLQMAVRRNPVVQPVGYGKAPLGERNGRLEEGRPGQAAVVLMGQFGETQEPGHADGAAARGGLLDVQRGTAVIEK